MRSMLIRRRNDRQARELARLLVTLDAAAAAARPWTPRPLLRATIASR